tara:strand:+ start:28 stop:468 length:441 start_codon:yes stop_codon:yes gene_type:complete
MVYLKMPLIGFNLSNFSFLTIVRFFKLFLFFILFFCGCLNLEVEKAFNGEFSRTKNNKVINDYCLNCHVHRNFHAKKHILTKRKSYKKNFYRKASDCRTCHYVEKIWEWNDLRRKTRYPSLVRKGFFLDFESKEIKKKKSKIWFKN